MIRHLRNTEGWFIFLGLAILIINISVIPESEWALRNFCDTVETTVWML
jgi:uncharacterized membrane protein